MTIHHEYLAYHEKYEKKYGSKTLILMQVGSFHEAYATKNRGCDLSKISELLNITFTRKDKKIDIIDEKNPYMLGFPSVAISKYIKILISAGYTIVVINQTTLPPNPKREIVGIYSPGTYIEESLSPDSNNIISIYIQNEKQLNGQNIICVGMSSVDLSTGQIFVHESHSKPDDNKFSLDETLRFINTVQFKELIIYGDDITLDKNIISYLELENKNHRVLNNLDKKFKKISYINTFLKKIYNNTGLLTPIEYLDLEKYPYAVISLTVLLDFSYQHNENIINHLKKPEIFSDNLNLMLGGDALFQLNVFDNNITDNYNNTQYKSLFDVLNHTSTAIGRRYLKYILSNPIVNVRDINDRLNSIEELISDNFYDQLNNHLSGIIDLERMTRKISLNIIHPHELYNTYTSLLKVQDIITLLINSNKLQKLDIKKLSGSLDIFIKYFDSIFTDELKKYNFNDIQNNIFKSGTFSEIDNIQLEIDKNLSFIDSLCSVLSGLIEDNKSRFNNNNGEKIYVKNNELDGYYLSLTKIRATALKKKLNLLIQDGDKPIINMIKPSSIQFKELSKGNTKIFSKELGESSDKIILLREKIIKMLSDCYVNELNKIYNTYGKTLEDISLFISKLDFYKSSAKSALLYGYTKPTLVTSKTNKSFVHCTDLRHPIIERINQDKEYVPHTIKLGAYKENKLDGMLIYGLNSSGKSTVMKAIGLAVIMAQSGMYVPAKKLIISPYHNLFARITSNDNIFKGLSSFVLEMTELKAILKRNNPNTLIIGDEVCRGTEHISGNAIVASTILNLSKTGCSFIFATHLHEIASMDRIIKLNNVKPFHLTVHHDDKLDQLVFDRQLKPGSGDRVYGYTVARYIIDDIEFMKTVQEIKNDLIGESNSLIPDRTSRYNSKLYIESCGICKKKASNSDEIGLFDTHHINFQENCENGLVKDKKHIRMNSKSNLVVLCKECHHKVHQNIIKINGYKDTSNGLILDFNEVN